jgi:hypothetical protein
MIVFVAAILILFIESDNDVPRLTFPMPRAQKNTNGPTTISETVCQEKDTAPHISGGGASRATMATTLGAGLHSPQYN